MLWLSSMKVNSASRSIGLVPFSQVLAEAAAERARPERTVVERGTERLRCQLTILAAGELRAPSAGARGCYTDETASGTIADRSAIMLEAVRRLQASLASSSPLSAAELRRMRREVAMTVHPDLCHGPDRRVAEELMKGVNILVTEALGGRRRS